MGRTLFAACMMALAAAAVSADATNVGNISFGGTGCPAAGNGIQVKVGSNGKRLIVYTPDMQVDLQSARLDRKACAITIPVALAADERLVLGRPSVFGKEQLAAGSQLTATAEVFFAGAQGPKVSHSLQGTSSPSVSDFYEIGADQVVSGCGEALNLRANTTVLATRAAGSADGGQAKVRGLAFDAKIEQCTVP
ncbi:MAG TPA: DUF4360 domain-containing protein [Bdellovibrionales bacterium]|nr:DUF4360 domain-containing protein [Bdellovibrionales bacterium]